MSLHFLLSIAAPRENMANPTDAAVALTHPRDPQIAHPAYPNPRIIQYHQTHFKDGQFISLLPILSEKPLAVTHVILAAIHINDRPGDITLNDDPWRSPKNDPIWAEAQTLQRAGIKVMGMLGGAAKGSFKRLDPESRTEFLRFYSPLRDLVQTTGLQGLDLDVEEDMSFAGIVRLILQLRRDFGARFIITLAPVATAMMEKPGLDIDPQRLLQMLSGHKTRTNLSGFSYRELEKAVGGEVDWYNVQFYCGWGSVENTHHYDRIVAAGWPAERVVMGMITYPGGGAGWVDDEVIFETLLLLTAQHGGFAGVMGWEYFGSVTAQEPVGVHWSWARLMTRILRPDVSEEAEARDQT